MVAYTAFKYTRVTPTEVILHLTVGYPYMRSSVYYNCYRPIASVTLLEYIVPLYLHKTPTVYPAACCTRAANWWSTCLHCKTRGQYYTELYSYITQMTYTVRDECSTTKWNINSHLLYIRMYALHINHDFGHRHDVREFAETFYQYCTSLT